MTDHDDLSRTHWVGWSTGDYSGTFAEPYDWQREDARQAVRDAHRPPRILFVVLATAAAALTFAAGYAVAQPDGAVCHSATEDSAITDCDYRDGGWYEK